MGAQFEDRWRTRFEEFAELSDDDAGIAGWSANGLDARLRRFLSIWKPVAAGGSWLDAGCGAGTYTRVLLRHGLSVIGLDYSLPTISKAVGRSLEAAAFAVADIRRIPFAPGSFDGVLCFGVTQALADSRPAVRELAVQLRPGGELWIDGLNLWCVVHAYGLLRRHLSRRPMHLRYESPARVMRMLEECGFTGVRLYWMPIVPGRSRALQRLVEAPAVDRLLRLMPFLAKLISHAFIVHATKLPLHPGDPENAHRPRNGTTASLGTQSPVNSSDRP